MFALWPVGFDEGQTMTSELYLLIPIGATFLFAIQVALWQYTWLRIAQRGGHWRAIAEGSQWVVRYPVVRNLTLGIIGNESGNDNRVGTNQQRSRIRNARSGFFVSILTLLMPLMPVPGVSFGSSRRLDGSHSLTFRQLGILQAAFGGVGEELGEFRNQLRSSYSRRLWRTPDRATRRSGGPTESSGIPTATAHRDASSGALPRPIPRPDARPSGLALQVSRHAFDRQKVDQNRPASRRTIP